MNMDWLWDRRIPEKKVKEILSDKEHKRFVEISALLLSRKNTPKEIFEEYIDSVTFVQNWLRIKGQMRNNNWNDQRIIFWQTVYEKLRSDFQSQGISIRESKTEMRLAEPCREIGRKIRAKRKEIRLTQAALAKKVGVSQQIISFIENGRENITLLTLNKVASCLGTAVTVQLEASSYPNKTAPSHVIHKEVKCLACQTTLYRIGPLDERGTMWALLEEDQVQYNSMRKGEPGKEYFECPHCKRQNWIASKKVEGKGLQEWISHVWK